MQEEELETSNYLENGSGVHAHLRIRPLSEAELLDLERR